MGRITLVITSLVGFLLTESTAQAADGLSVPTEPFFSRHIVPLLSRLGCNAGACHGMVQGKGGFRLSLFGVDPAIDHERLLKEANGRRINRVDPDASLLLLKATAQVPHEGGKRLEVGSCGISDPPQLDRCRCPPRSRGKVGGPAAQVTPLRQTARPENAMPCRCRPCTPTARRRM